MSVKIMHCAIKCVQTQLAAMLAVVRQDIVLIKQPEDAQVYIHALIDMN